MKSIWIAAGYAAASAAFSLFCRNKCKKDAVFKAPKRRWLYYLLSVTWGLPTVLIGGVIALFVRLSGYKPKPYGWEWCFEIPGISWGLELGLFFIAPQGDEALKMHEHGHGIQNLYLGFFNPLTVFLPSVVRFWYRELRSAVKKPCATGYDDIWFERSATASGKHLMARLKRKESPNDSGIDS